MMLRMTLDRPDDADLLEKAVDLALASGARTADIAEAGARKLSTKEMGDAVLAALDKVVEQREGEGVMAAFITRRSALTVIAGGAGLAAGSGARRRHERPRHLSGRDSDLSVAIRRRSHRLLQGRRP